MKIGYIGLGKMGINMVTRMLEQNHGVVAFDINHRAIKRVEKKGAIGADSLCDLIQKLGKNRIFWIMVPAAFVGDVLDEMRPHLRRGDIIVDGGNSFYKDSVRRARDLRKRGIYYIDVGVSGGPKGALTGACMMIGGKESVYKKLKPLFRDLCVKNGYAYMGTSGSGHYVKMVHNGIEYGMMQAMAEGFDLMHKNDAFKLDMNSIAKVYASGSVIESRLMSWMQKGYKKFGNDLNAVSATAIGTGEGEWTVKEAKNSGVRAKVIKHAYKARVRSKRRPGYQAKVIMTLRNQFGGHDPNPESYE